MLDPAASIFRLGLVVIVDSFFRWGKFFIEELIRKDFPAPDTPHTIMVSLFLSTGSCLQTFLSIEDIALKESKLPFLLNIAITVQELSQKKNLELGHESTNHKRFPYYPVMESSLFIFINPI